jgi:hypothetical protein
MKKTTFGTLFEPYSYELFCFLFVCLLQYHPWPTTTINTTGSGCLDASLSTVLHSDDGRSQIHLQGSVRGTRGVYGFEEIQLFNGIGGDWSHGMVAVGPE